MGKEAPLGLQEGLKPASLEEGSLLYHGRKDLPGLGSELLLSGLVGLGLGSALGYRDFGMLQPGGERRGKKGSLS